MTSKIIAYYNKKLENYNTLEKNKSFNGLKEIKKRYNPYSLNEKKLINVFQNQVLPINFLPPAIRYVDYNDRFFLIEKPPSYKTISVSSATKIRVRKENTKVYTIPVPWQNIVVYYSPLQNKKYRINNVYIYYATEPITDLKTHQFYRTFLHNIYYDGNVCLPKQYICQDITSMADSAYDAIWGSSFNRDLYDAFVTPLRTFNIKNEALIKEYGIDSFSESNFYKQMSKLTIEHIINFKYIKTEGRINEIFRLHENKQQFYFSINQKIHSYTLASRS